MGKWLRRIRGMLGTGAIWAVAWSAAGLVPRWLFGFNPDVPFPLVFGVLGFVAGVTFSALLVLTERRRTFDQLSLRRIATWGGVGGFLLSALFARAASLEWGDVLVVVPTFVIASTLCASGSLALARRATVRELPGISDTARLERADHEQRKLR